MQLTSTERKIRGNVISRIESLVQQLMPTAKFQPFGSFAWGFNLPTGDIDLLILEVADPAELRLLAAKIQDGDIAEENSIEVRDNTRVPFIEFIDRESKINIDITFENIEEMTRLGELLKKYRQEYPVFPKLVIVLKQFLGQHDLNKRREGKITSSSFEFKSKFRS